MAEAAKGSENRNLWLCLPICVLREKKKKDSGQRSNVPSEGDLSDSSV